MQLVLDSNGIKLSKRNNCFYLIHKKLGKRMISPFKISSIAITKECTLTTAALKLAIKHQIPVFICSVTGKSKGSFYSVDYSNHTEIRRRQILFSDHDECIAILIDWLSRKVKHLLENIKTISEKEYSEKSELWNARIDKFKVQREGKNVKDIANSLLGVEGSIAKEYWPIMNQTISKPWQFDARSRRPARDFGNSVLNYLYGMTYNLMENAIRDAGLDPYIGYLHVDGFQRMALVFDMIEVFRPWVDQLYLQVVTQSPNPKAKHFRKRGEGIWLSKKGRKWIIPKYNDFMVEKIHWEDYRTGRKNHMHRFAMQFVQFLKSI